MGSMDQLQRHNQIVELRATLAKRGHKLTIRQTRELLHHCGTVENVIDAMLMLDRPDWLIERVGPNPQCPLYGVLLNDQDRAGLNEYGHTGWPE